jgi:transketolase
MRTLPNMVVISPADAYEAYAATKAIADYNGPVYMRMGRTEFPTSMPEDTDFTIGKAKIMREGTDVTLVACGQMVSNCLEAADILASEGISAEVINMSTIKPLDTETLIASVSKTGCCVSAEEHSIIGGLGSAVAECLVENVLVPLERVGTKDTFGESGTPADLMAKYGLTAENVVSAAKQAISRKE